VYRHVYGLVDCGESSAMIPDAADLLNRADPLGIAGPEVTVRIPRSGKSRESFGLRMRSLVTLRQSWSVKDCKCPRPVEC